MNDNSFHINQKYYQENYICLLMLPLNNFICNISNNL